MRCMMDTTCLTTLRHILTVVLGQFLHPLSPYLSLSSLAPFYLLLLFVSPLVLFLVLIYDRYHQFRIVGQQRIPPKVNLIPFFDYVQKRYNVPDVYLCSIQSCSFYIAFSLLIFSFYFSFCIFFTDFYIFYVYIFFIFFDV